MSNGTDRRHNNAGFTLIELAIVIVIAGILVTIALRGGKSISETSKLEETRQEMDALARAIVGDPDLYNNGIRSDFGYVGDIGSLPPNLDALHTNPGGFATWRGPYVENRFVQTADDFKRDAWGSTYAYTGGETINSSGSGSTVSRRIVESTTHLLYNSVAGNVFDLDGTPPGPGYGDSVLVRLTFPDGIGGYTYDNISPDDGGFFEFDSIPVGNHDLLLVYQPTADTLRRFVSVLPNSRLYAEYHLPANVWPPGAGGSPGGVGPIAGSDSLYSDCHGFSLWIENTGATDIDVDWVTLSWLSPTAYYRYVIWDGTTVANENSPKIASGQPATFTSTQTLAAGASIRLDFDFFKSQPTGGPNVDMDHTDFTLTFSDGSSFEITTGDCP
ncbi:type II secretion system GspH family protein [bacterium]|nr:type II secretion system GspH family protein [bacterium]